ncbi:hypothetical protein BGZ65_007865, partial [Modicella reniformis]
MQDRVGHTQDTVEDAATALQLSTLSSAAPVTPSPEAQTTTQAKKSLADMPDEVLIAIALTLPCKEYARFLQTSRSMHIILNSHYVWHQRFITRFGQIILQERLNSLKTNNTDTTGAGAGGSASASSPSSKASTAPSSPRSQSDSNLRTNSSGSGSGNTLNQTWVSSGYFEYYHNHQDPSPAVSSPHSLSSSRASSPRSSGANSPQPVESGSEPGSGAGSEEDGEGADGNAKGRTEGTGRKVDLRRTNEASKELLIELYKKHSRMILPAEDMQICHLDNRYWKLIESASSTFGKLAQLQSVWWMDVTATFFGVPKGRYKVQWRVKVTSDAPIINTEFKVILFDKHEDRSVVTNRPDTILFKPRNVQEFMERTDSQVLKANRKPFRNVFRGFTILELPGEVNIADDFQNVFVQIRNYDGWKSGLCVDFVQLVDLNDSEKCKEQLISGVHSDRSAALEEEVNDEDEEYYPSQFAGILPWRRDSGRGINPHADINPRSRGVRQYNPVDSSVPLDVGARTPPASKPSSSSPLSSPTTTGPDVSQNNGQSIRQSGSI